MKHDAAVFIRIDTPTPLVRSFKPTLIDWRYPDLMPSNSTVLSAYARESYCNEVQAFREQTTEFSTTMMDDPVAATFSSNMWLVPCLWQQLAADTLVGGKQLYQTYRAVQPTDQAIAERLGWTSIRFPTAFAYNTLLQPRPHLLKLQLDLYEAADLGPDEAYIGSGFHLEICPRPLSAWLGMKQRLSYLQGHGGTLPLTTGLHIHCCDAGLLNTITQWPKLWTLRWYTEPSRTWR
jgi:hypothetical protein